MTSSSESLRVCVLGAGDMGVRHLRGWQNSGCEVVAVVDGIPERLQEAGEKYGVKGLYSDYENAIRETKPAVVSVCLPTSFHTHAAIFALEHGAHVLCEKPVALTVEEAELMKATAQRKGLVLAIGFMLRYSPAIDRLKHWISEGYIGRPIMVTSENIMEVRPKLVMHAKNINGGPVIDFWCHHFDLWSYLFESEPESLGGYGAIFGADKLAGENLGELAIDTAAVNIKYRSGDIAQFSTSWGLPIVFKTHHLDRDCFIGPKGYIIGDIRGTLTLITEDGKTDTVSNTGLDWWGHEVNVLADILRGSEQPYIGIDEGIAALKVSLAALEAIEKSQTIRL